MSSTRDAAGGSPLLRHANLIATPHTAFFSVESIASLAEQAARNVVLALGGDASGSAAKG